MHFRSSDWALSILEQLELPTHLFAATIPAGTPIGPLLPEIAAAVSEPLSRAGSTTIISNSGADGSGTGASKLTEDVVQVISQLSPIMQQLAGVDLERFLQDISKLPGAVTERLGTDTE